MEGVGLGHHGLSGGDEMLLHRDSLKVEQDLLMNGISVRKKAVIKGDSMVFDLSH